VIDEATKDDRDRLEPTMRMLWESGHRLAVVHAKAVFDDEVLSELTPGKRDRWPHFFVAGRVCVVVMDAEEEGIDVLPRETERPGLENDFGHQRAI
jgi:hypothetical protein